jgi:nucleotide-binding universal stress UspA family protein
MAPPPRSLDGSDWESDQAQAIAEAERYLSDMAQSLSGQVSGVESVVPYGRTAAQILATASRYQADGVVMATHGRTGFSHLLYGSVTEAVLASSQLPVFVVYARPGEQPPPPFSPSRARVLVPQNFSAYDASALQAALHIVGTRGELILVTVVPPAERVKRDELGHVLAYVDQQDEIARQQARDCLNEIAAALRKGPQPMSVKVDVRVGDPASGIAMTAIEEDADLIVMATHGRTGLPRAVLGSVAGAVLRTAPTPVLLVHPQPPATAAAEPEQLETRVPLAMF